MIEGFHPPAAIRRACAAADAAFFSLNILNSIPISSTALSESSCRRCSPAAQEAAKQMMRGEIFVFARRNDVATDWIQKETAKRSSVFVW